LNRAVDLIAEKKNNPRGRRGPQALKELGADASGTAIKLMKGRYGPYVTDGETNATVPDADNAESITLDQALALIAERAAKGGGKKKKKAAAKPKKAAAAKKETKAKTEKAVTPPTKKKAPAKAAGKKKPEPVAGE
jgi:DNA topoisomerase-1